MPPTGTLLSPTGVKMTNPVPPASYHFGEQTVSQAEITALSVRLLAEDAGEYEQAVAHVRELAVIAAASRRAYLSSPYEGTTNGH